MPGIPSFVSDGPWWWLFGFLFCVVFVRTQATYAIARWARAGADVIAERAEEQPSRRAALARRLAGPGMDRARAFIERWGFIAIPISFLTIGFQTMVNGTAGYTRMRWDLYTVALVPGSLIWATVYTLVFLGLWQAWATSPLLFLGIVAVLATSGTITVLRRRARRAETRPPAPHEHA